MHFLFFSKELTIKILNTIYYKIIKIFESTAIQFFLSYYKEITMETYMKDLKINFVCRLVILVYI